MEFFKKTDTDTHYGPFCWARIVPMKLPKGTPYFAQVMPTPQGHALAALECNN